jgi:hypothetical protein
MGIKKKNLFMAIKFPRKPMEFMTVYPISKIILQNGEKSIPKNITARQCSCCVCLCVFFLVLFLFGDVLRVGFLSLPERWG